MKNKNLVLKLYSPTYESEDESSLSYFGRSDLRKLQI